MSLVLRKSYNMNEIDALIKEHNLFEKVNGELQEVSDGLDGAIGEVVMPLYFEDGTVACNFILTGYSSTSFWRAIYVCESLSFTGKVEI